MAWRKNAATDASGFSLAEFAVSSLIVLAISAAVFSMLAETQRSASYQTEVQSVLQNTRVAMLTVERCIRQAGNDPRNAGFAGVTITSPTEARLRSDLTGSAAGNPDKGDPDADTLDSGEDITIRYNSGAQSIELVPNGGNAQAVANYITAFSMQYFDAVGAATTDGASVRKIRVSITGASNLPHPQTGKVYAMQTSSDIQLGTRQ